MKKALIAVGGLIVALCVKATAPEQTTTFGRIDRLEIPSRCMNRTMTVDVWTPEGYDTIASKLPVIYMHDGQNLFDASTTWNHQSWEMDSVVQSLINYDRIDPVIIVGIHTPGDTRLGDLAPRKAISDVVKNGEFKGQQLHGDDYVRFMVGELRDEVARRYKVDETRANTYVMGSSMGGLMSVYALCEYPDVFGNAVCMSTHWVGDASDSNPDAPFSKAMYEFLESSLPVDGCHRLYFDHGTTTIDALYGPSEERVIRLCEEKGYIPGESLETYIAQGAAHEENAWMIRVERSLIFMLGKKAD